jgi:hypothetical protein
MNRMLIGGLVVAVGFAIVAASLAVEGETKKVDGGKLRHVVLFKFKDTTSAEKIKEIEDGFRGLPKKIPEIVDFEWGTNVSVENKSEGFTHCFIVSFNNADGRAVYLPHPAHKEFGTMLGSYLDKVLVVDFEAKK